MNGEKSLSHDAKRSSGLDTVPWAFAVSHVCPTLIPAAAMSTC